MPLFGDAQAHIVAASKIDRRNRDRMPDGRRKRRTRTQAYECAGCQDRCAQKTEDRDANVRQVDGRLMTVAEKLAVSTPTVYKLVATYVRC